MNNKDKLTRRQIYRRTIAGFLVFYLLAMAAVTAVAQAGVRRDNVNTVAQCVQEAAENVWDDRSWQRPGSDWTVVPTISFGNMLDSAMGPIKWARIPIKQFYLDGSQQVLEASGTILLDMRQETIQPKVTTMQRAYCQLGDYLSDQELLEIWRLLGLDDLKTQAANEKTSYDCQAQAHWEGQRLVPSKLLIVQNNWSDLQGHTRTLLDREVIATYELGPVSYTHQRRGTYNARVQQGFDRCDQLAADIQPQLAETAERRVTRQGLLGRDMVAIQPVSQTLDGQEVGWLVLAASGDTPTQIIIHLAKVYGVGLLLAALIAWLGLRKDKRQEADA